jgi:hypothetical protein
VGEPDAEREEDEGDEQEVDELWTGGAGWGVGAPTGGRVFWPGSPRPPPLSFSLGSTACYGSNRSRPAAA